MMKRAVAALMAIAAATGGAGAQIPDWVPQILLAAELPVSAAEARREGAASDQVRQTVNAMSAARLRAHEARDLLDGERAARRAGGGGGGGGPSDNFGAFVQARLAAGLRGRELAAAIKAEHAARGKGKAAAATRPTQGKRPNDKAARPTGRPTNR